jgi:uncharacterized metal-binding protein
MLFNESPTCESPMPAYGCRYCASAGSFKGDLRAMPKTCPTLTHRELATDTSPYLDADRAELMRVADRSPIDDEQRKRNRVEELAFYARGRRMKRIGIAFCVSLLEESQELARQLEAEGLETELVCCRVGAVDYDRIGLEKAHPERFAAICNPAAQARLLNERDVDLVAQVGLCIGHDLILQEECVAPVTTLVVKDRALDHHSVQALRPTATARGPASP